MNLKDILAKIAKGEAITDAEKAFIESYDPIKATNDAAAAARRKAEEDAAKYKAELDKIKADAEEAARIAQDEKNKGMTENEKLTAQLKTLADSVSALTKGKEEAEAKAQATLRSQAIRDAAKKAGITLAPKTVDERLFFRILESTLEGVDVADAEKLNASLTEFKESNAGIILAPGAGGAGDLGNPGGPASSGKNPWKKESFNLTDQIEIETSDPSKAKTMMAAAGVS